MPEENEQDINYEEENNESGAVDTKDRLKKLKDRLRQCQQEKQDYLAGWQRSQADFINYKRRQEKQVSDWSKMLGEGLIYALLSVLDALESGIVSRELEENKAEDLQLIKKQFLDILRRHGLEEIKTVGEKFNPEYHEAIEQVESENEPRIAIEEIQKGYMLNGKVIRVAKVKVTK